MKNLRLISLTLLISSHFSIKSWAMGDIERGGLFLINLTSLGTLLPTMEADIE